MTDEEMATAAESADAPAEEEVIEGEAEEITEDEAEEETGEPDAEDGEPAEDEEQEDPDLKSAKQKAAELSYKLREQKRQNARILRLLEQQEARNQQASAPQPPKLEDFETIDEYVDAKLDWKLNQQSKPQPTQAADNTADIAEFEVAREDMIANGIAKHPDFEDVVLAEDVDISLAMANALVEIDDTDLQVDTAYYLGTNPKEASRIAKLSPIRQIAEIAKLSAKIEAKRAKPVKRPSRAPKPIKPVGGSRTSSNQINPDDDMATFIAKRNKQLGRA